MTKSIFVPGVGQYDNIGDIILRRQLIDWLRPLGDLHIYLGPAPEGYAEGLGVQPEDRTYRSFGAWYLAGLRSAMRGNTSYVFKPGEIQLTVVGMKEHVAMLPLALAVRLRRGGVVRVGVGSRNFAPLPRLMMKPSIGLSTVTRWRDDQTAAYLGGASMPDLAFGEGAGDAHNGTDAPDAAHRDVLVVEMRNDRPYPTPAWIAGVRSYAELNGLSIWAVTQVLRDSERSQQLATDLGGSLLDWDGTGHDQQEERLRAVYRRARLAVSDRLHVLVTAFTEGAVPVAPLVGGGSLVGAAGKIERHFQSAGIAGISFDTAGLRSDGIVGGIGAAVARREELFTALDSARHRLELVRRDVARAVA